MEIYNALGETVFANKFIDKFTVRPHYELQLQSPPQLQEFDFNPNFTKIFAIVQNPVVANTIKLSPTSPAKISQYLLKK
jgi:hypothetical protein